MITTPRPARGSCACAAPGCSSAPGLSRSSSATCSRAASAGCRRPTGRAACGWAHPARGSADMAPASSPRTRRGTPRAAEGGPGGGPRAGRGDRAGAADRWAGRRADPARRAACDVLRAVAERGAYANLLLPALLTERGLTRRDAALATELAYGALRGQGSYDAILAICSDRDLDRIDPPLRPVLRLGAHQLLATRVGAHAAVSTSVDLARDLAGPPPARFGHAVPRPPPPPDPARRPGNAPPPPAP